jgi:hypothetical protein
MSSPPFLDQEAGELDMSQIWTEAIPLAGLVALFGGLALVPFLVALLLGGNGFAFLFTLLAQFVLAVGAGIVLMYVVARGVALGGA